MANSYRISGTQKSSGVLVHLSVTAATEEAARKIADDKGLLVSSIHPESLQVLVSNYLPTTIFSWLLTLAGLIMILVGCDGRTSAYFICGIMLVPLSVIIRLLRDIAMRLQNKA